MEYKANLQHNLVDFTCAFCLLCSWKRNAYHLKTVFNKQAPKWISGYSRIAGGQTPKPRCLRPAANSLYSRIAACLPIACIQNNHWQKNIVWGPRAGFIEHVCFQCYLPKISVPWRSVLSAKQNCKAPFQVEDTPPLLPQVKMRPRTWSSLAHSFPPSSRDYRSTELIVPQEGGRVQEWESVCWGVLGIPLLENKKVTKFPFHVFW